jgi:hypothetical protein
MAAKASKTPSLKPINQPDLAMEIRKVEARLKALADELADPELGFADSVRLSVQQRELQAYARGLRFAIGEAPSWQDSSESQGSKTQRAS